MLVPHTDLAKNNHQPMEGTCSFLTLLIRGETPFFLCFLCFFNN